MTEPQTPGVVLEEEIAHPLDDSRVEQLVERRVAPPPIGLSVARHALAWLAVSCALGLALATLLSFPNLGLVLGTFGYGRLMALHLDLALYGWTAIPLLGLLLAFFEIDARPREARALVALWSATLTAGAVSWLRGRTSGKLFLDWTGGARTVFLALLGLLLAALVARTASRWRVSPGPKALRVATLGALATVPPAMALATRRNLYPPVDPTSGAPTGVSLLASTLTLVLVLLALPRLAGLERRPGHPGLGWALLGALAVHSAVCLMLFGPDRPADDGRELAAIASVLPWVVLVPLDYRRFAWPRSAQAWFRATVAWGVVLAVSGVLQFLPAPLAAARYTHLLVAHAHAAMAGFTSSATFVILELGLAGPRPLGGRPAFVLWQGGSALHVAALAGVGVLEVHDPAAVLRGSVAVSALFALRWCAGATMLGGALSSLREAWERT